MTTYEIIEYYSEYVENLISEGFKITLEDAVEYAYQMFKEETLGKTNRNHRFIGLKKLKDGLREKFIDIGLK